MLDDPKRAIGDAIARAEPIGPATGPHAEQARHGSPAAPQPEGGDFDAGDGPAPFGDYDGDENGPSDLPPDGSVDLAIVEYCAALDHSDTDNGERLRRHFGKDLVVMRQAGAKTPVFVTWSDTFWDTDGMPGALRLAQLLGSRIALEAGFLKPTPDEVAAMRRASEAAEELDALEDLDNPTEAQKQRIRQLRTIVELGDEASAALEKRKIARRKFAVSSKNKARIDAALYCAASHIMMPPEAFDADPLAVATKECTLHFDRVIDPECPDPDATRWIGRVTVTPGHEREDFITKVVPVVYDPAATCPKFMAFMERFQPIATTRRAVQVATSLCMLGLTEQKLFFHYGAGANGKSVYMETFMRVLGPLGVGLPAESISGSGERGAGQANPDIARLPGIRALRVLEVPADKPLQEEFIKKITGGETMPARPMYGGYFEFKPVFTCHMSGNGYPRIDGTDNGIWRRMVVFAWPVTLTDDEQKNFDDVIAEFVPEYQGILNWLIEGVLIYLTEGLRLPPEVKAATKEYRDEMDPIGMFVADCVAVAPGEHIAARELYRAYEAWSETNAKRPISPNKFGRVMKARFKREDGAIHRYLDCRLHDVPYPPPRSPSERDYDEP